MYSFVDNEEFRDCYKNGKYYHFRDVLNLVPEWSDILKNLNMNLVRKTVQELSNYGFVTRDALSIPHVVELLTDLAHIDPTKRFNAHCYTSLSTASNTFGPHKDTENVLIWQTQGITKWTLFNEMNEKIFEEDLSSGQMLYIPSGLMHNTQPMSARSLISFGIY